MTVDADKDGGMSLRALAAVLRVSPAAVRRDLRAAHPDAGDGTILVGKCMGLDGKMRPDRRFDTTVRDDNIRQLRASGATMRDIATSAKCSVGTVHRVLSLFN